MSIDSGGAIVQHQFLPAALELQERPPSPTGRTLLWLLILFFVVALTWAIFGQVDIVVTAPGRIIPSGQVKVVQSGLGGVISGIEITEGEHVLQGERLVSLDNTNISSEIFRLESELKTVRLEASWRERLDQWLKTGTDPLLSSNPVTLTEQTDISEADNLLREKITEISANVLGMEMDLASTLSELDAITAERQRVLATLSVLSKRVRAYASLVENQHGAQVQYLELLQQQTDLEKSVPGIEAQQRKLRTGADAIDARISAFISETRNRNLARLSSIESEKSSFSNELQQAIYNEGLHTISAPVSGTVEELAFHTVGGVIRSGETVLNIVPEGVSVEIDALLENKDIGFVSEGFHAEVKVDTFNFTKYGMVQAIVTNISDDAIEDRTGAWKYPMKLALQEQTIAVGDKLLALTPGMSTSVEIKIGSRRVIEFLLTPLLRYKHESIRER